MGVHGLQNFMKKSCQGSTESCNILDKAKSFRQLTGQSPLLIIDGTNCLIPMYILATADKAFTSCRMKIAVDYFAKFLERLLDGGIEIKVFFDGSPPDDRLALARMRGFEILTAIKDVYCVSTFDGKLPNVQDLAANQKCLIPYKEFKLCLQSRFKSMEIPWMESTIDVDQEIMEFVREYGCFGILSQDSDFIIHKGFKNVFSVSDLNPETLDTTVFRRDVLAHCLNLPLWQLPFFATVCGNDIVTRDTLRKFHERFITRHMNFARLKGTAFLPAVVIFPPIAAWLRPILDQNQTREDLPEYLAKRADLPSHKEHFRKSVMSYKPSYNKELDDNTALKGGENWSKIVKEAKARVEQGLLLVSSYCILTRAKALMSVAFQIYDDPDNYPCDNILLETLMRRQWGVLLKERPDTFGARRDVLEITVKGEDHRDKVIPSTEPPEHPGLLRLWSDKCPTEDKWKMLCWIVSPGLKPEDVLQMPEELRVPGMAIFYLCNKMGSRIKEFQMEALLVTAVKMLTATKEELSAHYEWFDPVATHWGSVYQSICYAIYTASGVCGNPSSLYQHPDYIFFDANIYGAGVYQAIEKGEAFPRQLCAQNNITLRAYDKVKSFLSEYLKT